MGIFTAHTENGKKVLTMDEYLDKEAFKKSVEERYCKPCKAEKKDHNGCWCRACWVDDMLDEVECFQPADVALVRYGRWVDNHCTACGMMPMGDEMWELCDFEPPRFEKFMYYCPNCGAKMGGGAD